MRKALKLNILVNIVICSAIMTVSATDSFAELSKQADEKIRVCASFYPLYFFAEEIGGDKVVVYNITPSGAEPHDYDITAQDMVRIQDSKLLIFERRRA